MSLWGLPVRLGDCLVLVCCVFLCFFLVLWLGVSPTICCRCLWLVLGGAVGYGAWCVVCFLSLPYHAFSEVFFCVGGGVVAAATGFPLTHVWCVWRAARVSLMTFYVSRAVRRLRGERDVLEGCGEGRPSLSPVLLSSPVVGRGDAFCSVGEGGGGLGCCLPAPLRATSASNHLGLLSHSSCAFVSSVWCVPYDSVVCFSPRPASGRSGTGGPVCLVLVPRGASVSFFFASPAFLGGRAALGAVGVLLLPGPFSGLRDSV